MRTLHIDTGREMRGGQWQVLRLVSESGGCYIACGAGFAVVRACPHGAGRRRASFRGGNLALVAPRGPGPRTRRTGPLAGGAIRAPSAGGLAPRGLPPGKTLLSRLKYARVNRYIAVSRRWNSALWKLACRGHGSGLYRTAYRCCLCRASKVRSLLQQATIRARVPLVREAAELAGVEVRFSKIWRTTCAPHL